MEPSPELRVLGVYPVEGSDEPCHLIEMSLRNFCGELRLGEITQPEPGVERSSWQVPYWEQRLDEHGFFVVEDLFPGPVRVDGELRFVFYFHYLDLSAPLRTQFGPVLLPGETPTPNRLSALSYSPP